MTVHVVDIETADREIPGISRAIYATMVRAGITMRQDHRWRCSCGAAGKWKSREFTARQGGTLHQRKMAKPKAQVE